MVVPNKEVVSYFEKGIKMGLSLEVLSKNLLNGGWSQEQVSSARQSFRRESSSQFRAPRPNQSLIHKGEKEGIPGMVKAVSIIYLIEAILLILFPILIFIFGASFLGSFGAFLGGAIGVLFLIIALPFIILFFVLFKKIKKGRNWARIVALIISILVLISGLMSLIKGNFFFGIPGFLVQAFIFYALLFDRETKNFFKKTNPPVFN